MIAKRLVVIGASAGGIEALRSVLAGIPDTFPAAICVVLHTSPESPGVLADILNRSGQVPVSQASDKGRLVAGHVYVAPPDHHLLVEPGRVRVVKGPREHRFRPAIDPLFRSAAQVFGPAVIGIVLTGNLDDGTAGLWTIKKLGGIGIVQDPSDAQFSSMPLHALNNVDVDHVVPLSGIAALLVALTADVREERERVAVSRQIDVEVAIAKGESPRAAGLEQLGTPSAYSCPDCHGVLLELEDDGRIRFRCHTGHAYSVESLLAAMNEVIERAIISAVRALEEGSILMQDVATQLTERTRANESQRLLDSSQRAKQQAEAIRQLLLEPNVVPSARE
ncbi:MAG TPA: chemotaxis protein CheB [Vicinamibacterales bacterium]|nr:chemotaxis protein CheB [Vicinamibacterales bacterium]